MKSADIMKFTVLFGCLYVMSMRSCLAGLPTRGAMAEVGRLLWCHFVRADGERTRTALVGISTTAAFFGRVEIPSLRQMDGT